MVEHLIRASYVTEIVCVQNSFNLADRASLVDGGVQLFVDLVGHAVLLAADHANLYLEERVRFHRRLQQSAAMRRFSSRGTADPSQMCD